MDQSWVMIHSVSRAVNVEKIEDYIDRYVKLIFNWLISKYILNKNILRCFQIVTGSKKKTENKVIIHICSSHVMKTIINKISSLTRNKSIKDFYGFVFARMVNSTTLKELVEIFEQLCKLSLSNFIGSEQIVSHYSTFYIFHLK